MPKIISSEWSERKVKRRTCGTATKQTSMRLPRGLYYDLSDYAACTQRTLTEVVVLAWDHYYRHLKSEGRWPPKVERHDLEDLIAKENMDLNRAKHRSKELDQEKKGGVWSPPKVSDKLKV